MFDPVWNKRIEESDRALDPLGMNRVNDRFLNYLLSGITTVTPRARYYSFYVWTINQVGINAQTLNEFKNKFYDVERLFMMSCLAHEQLGGRDRVHTDINGSDKGRRIWGESNQNITLDFRYFGNKLGGYGQYYQGAIARLGLTTMSENSVFEKPTELGLEIADSFEFVAKKSGFKDLIRKKTVNKEELEKCGRTICLCRLKTDKSNDLQPLRTVFFDLKKRLGGSVDFYRQQTLSIILLCCETSAKHNFKLTDQHFLDACYYGQIREKKEVFQVYFPKPFAETVSRWKIFRAHDYLAYSAEALLSQFLKLIAEEPSGATKEDFVNTLTSREAFSLFKSQINLELAADDFSQVTLRNLLDLISEAQGVSVFTKNPGEVSQQFDKKVLLTSKHSEYTAIKTTEKYFEEKSSRPELTVASWLTLLASIYERFFWVSKTKQSLWGEFLIRQTNLSHGLSPATFVASCENLFEKDVSLLDFVKWFVEEYVIEQARHVYEEKSFSFQYKPRCWFHKEGDRYLKDRDYQPGHRNARFESAISILEDLGLIIVNASSIELSTDGTELLSTTKGAIET